MDRRAADTFEIPADVTAPPALPLPVDGPQPAGGEGGSEAETPYPSENGLPEGFVPL